ncbi:hypothetical protein [Devosia sp.]|uniref:hypothetical protein n=1 Tax=Devosia sp. TaxID=1871048 RepID=UPI003BAD517C
MPTLIRLFVILLVLAGLGYGAMFGLVAAVTPKQKDVTIRIPPRELVAGPERDPLVKREINTTRKPDGPADATPAVAVDTPAADVPADATAPNEGDVVTKEQGVE